MRVLGQHLTVDHVRNNKELNKVCEEQFMLCSKKKKQVNMLTVPFPGLEVLHNKKTNE